MHAKDAQPTPELDLADIKRIFGYTSAEDIDHHLNNCPRHYIRGYYAEIYLGSTNRVSAIKSNNDKYLLNQILRAIQTSGIILTASKERRRKGSNARTASTSATTCPSGSLQCTSSQQSQRSAPVQEPGRSPATQTKLGGKSVIQLMADTRISAQASLSHQSPDLCLDVSKMSSKPASPIPHSNNMKETWRAAQQMRPSSDRLSEHDMGHRVPYFSQNPLAQFRSQISGRHPAGMQPVLFSPLSRAALQMEWYQQQHINHQIGSFMQASQAMRHRLVLPIAPRHIINQMQTHRDISPPCSQRAVPPPKPGLTVHHNSSDDVHNQSPGSARTHSMVPPTSLSCYPSNHKECQVAGTRESNDAEHLERLHRISGALMSKCIDSRYEQHPQIQHPTQENCVRGTGLLREEPGRGCFTPWQKASERMTSPRASTETGQSICKLVRPTPIRAAYKPEQQKEGGESNRQSEEEKDSCDDVEISEDDEPMDDPFPTRASSTAEDFLQYEREKLKNRSAARKIVQNLASKSIMQKTARPRLKARSLSPTADCTVGDSPRLLLVSAIKAKSANNTQHQRLRTNIAPMKRQSTEAGDPSHIRFLALLQVAQAMQSQDI